MSQLPQAQELPVRRQQRSSVRSQELLPPLASHLERLRPFRCLFPHHFPARRFQACQRCVRLVTPVKPVQVTFPVNRCVEVQPEILPPPHHPVREVRPQLQKCASLTIARRNEHLVVEPHRARRIYRLIAPAPPREREIHVPGRRVNRHQPARWRIRLASRKHEHLPLSVDHRRNW